MYVVLMAAIVSEFSGISGVDMLPPETLAELIPWLLQVIVAVVLVLAVFKLIAYVGLFGKGKMLSAVHRVVSAYRHYDGLRVWCPRHRR